MYKGKDIENLSDEKLIEIANVFERRDDWQVSKKYAEEQNIYEVLVDGGEGQYVAIVQFLWGQQYEAENDSQFIIRHFDADFMEGSPTEEEMQIISEIIFRP